MTQFSAAGVLELKEDASSEPLLNSSTRTLEFWKALETSNARKSGSWTEIGQQKLRSNIRGKPITRDSIVERTSDANVQLEAIPVAAYEDREAAQDAMDKMLVDLITAQQHVEENTLVIAERDAEILELRQKIDTLSSTIKDRDSQTSAVEKNSVDREALLQRELYQEKGRNAGLEAELRRLELAREKEGKSEKVPKSHSQSLVQPENFMKQNQAYEDKIKSLNTELQHQAGRADHFERELLEIKNKKVELQAILDATVQQQNATEELQRLRKMINFYKSNSERLSREKKDMKGVIAALQEKIQSKDQDLDFLADENYALRLQIGQTEEMDLDVGYNVGYNAMSGRH